MVDTSNMFRSFLLFALFFYTEPSFAQQRPVVLELVLAVDTSTSVDTEEFELQRGGLADAFAHPDLINVIEGMGEKGIAVTLVEWAGGQQQATIVEWTLVNSATSALQVSSKIRSAPRAFSGMTDIGSAIRHSVNSLESNGFLGARKVIDVSGDGSGNEKTTSLERDIAISRGITINGLVILQKDYDLGELAEIDLIQHYSNAVIGGNGAFLMTAVNFEDFRRSILNKLLREIRGTSTAQFIPNQN
jgi:hypothetical protein